LSHPRRVKIPHPRGAQDAPIATEPPQTTPAAQRGPAVTLARAIGLIIALFTAFTLAAAALERLVEPETFHSFPDACWWAVQTVSTVGYGDDVPRTAAGRIVATVVMLFGMAFVPAITSIVVAILLDRRRDSDRSRPADRGARI
jgi:voltage-gated potassium channel